MSVCSRLGTFCRLPAMILVLSWFMTQSAASDGPGAAAPGSSNPLRDGEPPWNRDRQWYAPPQLAPPPLAVKRLPTPLLPVSRPPSRPIAQLQQPAPPLRPYPQPTSAFHTQQLAPAICSSPADLPRVPLPNFASQTRPAPALPEERLQVAPARLLPVSAQVERKTPEPLLQPAPLPSEPPPAAVEGLPPGMPVQPNSSDPTGEASLGTAQPQMWLPSASPCRCGVVCPMDGCGHGPGWHAMRPIPWQVFAQGEYVGPARLAHVPQYHIRVDDIIRVVYGLTGEPSSKPYDLSVGDVIRIESLGSPNLDRQVAVQPDGMVTMQILGQVPAAGRSIEELRKDLESRYSRYVREPVVSVTPVKLNTRVEELRASVDQRYGTGGQGVFVRVTPAGFIQLPSIGSVPAQGLMLDEIKQEIEARYSRRFHGIEVTPVLDRRAPRYVFVIGEVKTSGRFELEGPTTVMQAIAMAGSWNVGADLRQIVVFRRDECWRLMATRLDLRPALGGKRPCPADEIWIRDSDVILVPKSSILATDDLIQLVFTRGLYGVVPLNVGLSWTNLTTL